MDLSKLSASDGTGEAVRGTITATRLAASTILKVNFVTKWPANFTATSGTLLTNNTLDPSTITVFYGHLSGIDIIIDGFAPGYTDNGNTVGQVVVIKPTTYGQNTLVNGLLVSHNADGTQKANSVTTTAIADGAVTPAKRSGGFATGSFTQSANGTVVITGGSSFNFVPKLLRFTASFNQNVAGSNNASMSIGTYDVTAGTNTSVTTAARNGQGTGGYLSTAYAINMVTVATGGAGANAGTATVTSVGSGTFTLVFSSVVAPGVNVLWEALA